MSTDPEFFDPNFEPITFEFNQTKSLPYGETTHPLATDTALLDFFFLLDDSCPNLKGLIQGERATREEHYTELVKPTYDKLGSLGYTPSKVGQESWNLGAVNRIFDNLWAQLFYTGEFISGTDSDFYRKLEIAMSINTALNYPTETIQKLWTHSISNNMIDNMDIRIAGKNRVKLRMYSGHDSNLLPFMLRYGLMDENCLQDLYQKGQSDRQCETHPTFASLFVWELNQRTSDQKYFVRILFNGKEVLFCEKHETIGGK